MLFSGIIRLRDGFHDRYPVEDYLDLFDLAAHQIQNVLQEDTEKGFNKLNNIIIGKEIADYEINTPIAIVLL